MRPDSAIKKTLIYRIGSLGDIIVSLPCFHLIERTYPASERILLTNFPIHAKAPLAAEVLGQSGLISGYMRYSIGTRSPLELLHLARQIRRLNPDVLIYLMPLRSPKALRRDKRFFKFACGIRSIVGLTEAAEPVRIQDPSTALYESEAVRLARTLETLGDAATPDLTNWSLRLTRSERQSSLEALGAMAGKPLFVCGPGTKMQAKDWGQENWRSLLRQLRTLYPDYGLAIVGANDDTPVGDYVLSDWHGPKINLCGRLTPRETAGILEHASVFLGPDSGPMHLAACAKVPCVIAFSARGLPGVWYPIGNRHKVLYRNVSCSGCNLETCVTEKRRCLTAISVNDMASAVQSVLNNPTWIANDPEA